MKLDKTILIKCPECENSYILFDEATQGYNGFVCHDCKTPDGKIRLDEYAMNNGICYPLRLSLLDENGSKVDEIECNTKKDFTGYKKCSATDVWL